MKSFSNSSASFNRKISPIRQSFDNRVIEDLNRQFQNESIGRVCFDDITNGTTPYFDMNRPRPQSVSPHESRRSQSYGSSRRSRPRHTASLSGSSRREEAQNHVVEEEENTISASNSTEQIFSENMKNQNQPDITTIEYVRPEMTTFEANQKVLSGKASNSSTLQSLRQQSFIKLQPVLKTKNVEQFHKKKNIYKRSCNVKVNPNWKKNQSYNVQKMNSILPKKPEPYMNIRSNYSRPQETEKFQNTELHHKSSMGIFDSNLNTSVMDSVPQGSIAQSSIMASEDEYPEQPQRYPFEHQMHQQKQMQYPDYGDLQQQYFDSLQNYNQDMQSYLNSPSSQTHLRHSKPHFSYNHDMRSILGTTQNMTQDILLSQGDPTSNFKSYAEQQTYEEYMRSLQNETNVTGISVGGQELHQTYGDPNCFYHPPEKYEIISEYPQEETQFSPNTPNYPMSEEEYRLNFHNTMPNVPNIVSYQSKQNTQNLKPKKLKKRSSILNINTRDRSGSTKSRKARSLSLKRTPMQVVRGRLVQSRDHFHKIMRSVDKKPIKFKFKVYDNLREILVDLNLQNHTHFFIDRGVTTTGQFYNLDEATMRHMLIPAQARGVILRYIKYYKKKLIKKRKVQKVKEVSPRYRFQKKPAVIKNVVAKPIQQPPMVFKKQQQFRSLERKLDYSGIKIPKLEHYSPVRNTRSLEHFTEKRVRSKSSKRLSKKSKKSQKKSKSKSQKKRKQEISPASVVVNESKVASKSILKKALEFEPARDEKKLRMLQLINELNTLVNEQTQLNTSNNGLNSFGTKNEGQSNTFYDYVQEQTNKIFDQPGPQSVYQSINHYTSQETHQNSIPQAELKKIKNQKNRARHHDSLNMGSTMAGLTRTYEKNPLANTQCIVAADIISESEMQRNSNSTMMNSRQGSAGGAKYMQRGSRASSKENARGCLNREDCHYQQVRSPSSSQKVRSPKRSYQEEQQRGYDLRERYPQRSRTRNKNYLSPHTIVSPSSSHYRSQNQATQSSYNQSQGIKKHSSLRNQTSLLHMPRYQKPLNNSSSVILNQRKQNAEIFKKAQKDIQDFNQRALEIKQRLNRCLDVSKGYFNK